MSRRLPRPRRCKRVDLLLTDDLTDSDVELLSFCATEFESPRRRKRTPCGSPQRRGGKRRGDSTVASTSTGVAPPRNKRRSCGDQAMVSAASSTANVIHIVESPQQREISKSVSGQVEAFFNSSLLLSSDEEDDAVVILDDSINMSESHTSSYIARDNHVSDILRLVDLDAKENQRTDFVDLELKSMKALQQDTEEVLGQANTILDKFIKPKERNEGQSKVEERSCPICLEKLSGRPTAATFCGHIFCHECIISVAKTQKKCPTCRSAITLKKIHPIYL